MVYWYNCIWFPDKKWTWNARDEILRHEIQQIYFSLTVESFSAFSHKRWINLEPCASVPFPNIKSWISAGNGQCVLTDEPLWEAQETVLGDRAHIWDSLARARGNIITGVLQAWKNLTDFFWQEKGFHFGWRHRWDHICIGHNTSLSLCSII